MSEINYKVPLENESNGIANFTMPVEIANEMYSNWESADGLLYSSQEKNSNGVTYQFENSSLNFVLTKNEQGIDEVAVLGNTVKRLCPRKPEGVVSCEDCALTGLTLRQRVDMNCARSNVEYAFDLADVPADARFMITPTSSDVFVFGDELPGTAESAGDGTAFRTLPKAQAVVIPESAAKALDLEKIGIGMNGADSTFGLMTFETNGERVVVPFCSTRENMGDRTEDEQILRKAINAYLDSKELEDIDRQRAIEQMDVSVIFGASATLRNFAHKIKLPNESEDAPEKERKKAQELREKFGADHVTSAMVLDDMYPGALQRGNIWPQFEAEAADLALRRGIKLESPITPDRCPGDGQTCHVDYRAETKYALEKQLRELGVRNVSYNEQDAMDPADIDNNMASSRAEQNNLVERNSTNRTLNAAVFSFDKR